MKIAYTSFFVLLSVFVLTSSSLTHDKNERLFKKVVIVELDLAQDSVLLKPNSKAWMYGWRNNSDIFLNNGAPLMGYDEYIFAFEGRTENLWTILHPMIIRGNLHCYYPTDYTKYGMGPRDDGELRYPVLGENEDATFLTSDTIRQQLSQLLGRSITWDIPLVTEYGEDSIVGMPDGTSHYVYPTPEFMWYEDSDIAKYKLRVSFLLNKQGKVKKRTIEAIAPIVYIYADFGISGERDLLWLDYSELEPTLESTYYFDENWKPITYLEHIEARVKSIEP